MTVKTPAGVGWTALLVASQRAAESRRPDALFRDPLAEAVTDEVVAGARPGEPAVRLDPDGEPTIMTRCMGDYLAIRTSFLDDYLRSAALDGIAQIVIPAAGMDGRAFRLPWPPGTRIYEIDSAEVLDFKQHVIAKYTMTPTAERVVIPADLGGAWTSALCESGFDPRLPSAWVLEGLVYYLNSAGNDELLNHISDLAAPGSRIAVEYPHSFKAVLDGFRASVHTKPGDTSATTTAQAGNSGPAADPGIWLPAHHWTKSLAVHRLADVAEPTGRHAPTLMDNPPGTPLWWFATASR